ncbi:hypothetical protein ACFO4E_20880 [Nocardiopsis mangrovi]|uniref:DUF5753 domain-containing protein n=1 Tax=Nocardiopsis mangrovi TaxID=1179818 RepID=A0ABV9DZK3_9ACTN
MSASVTLAHVALLVMDSPDDTVIAVSPTGNARVCRRGELTDAEHEIYSRRQLLDEGIGPSQPDVEALAARLTSRIPEPHLIG